MKYDLYNGEVELHFDEKKHVYTVDGVAVDSVTSITKIIDKSGPLMWWASRAAVESLSQFVEDRIINPMIPEYDEVEWEEAKRDAYRAHMKKSREAAGIGTLVHDWVEQWATGKKLDMPRNPEASNSVNSFLGWAAENNLNVLDTEFKVYSRDYNFAGTVDCEATVNGEHCLIDWKTSKDVYPEYALQLAGYQLAREEEYGPSYDARWIVCLPKDGGKIKAKRYGQDIYDKQVNGFLGALALKKSLKK